MIESIELWHKRARHTPTERDLDVQIACHFEEIVEMLDTLVLYTPLSEAMGKHTMARSALHSMSQSLKTGLMSVGVADRKELLDSLADQIVTAVGVGHCAGMKTAEACERVTASNWSKTVDGEFIRDAQGKIAKPATYVAPDLEGLY